MQEKLLHFIWQNLLFDFSKLQTTDFQEIQIIQRGSININAGPDFTNAKINIDKTLWVGNVEIHIQSADWNSHGHTKDIAYDSTILHVCWEENLTIYRTDGSKIPCLTLSERVNKNLLASYNQLMTNAIEIPCNKRLNEINEFTMQMWQQRLVIERLEQKTNGIIHLLKQCNYDWQSVFYQSIAKTLGLKINTEPFEIMTRHLPQKILSKHKENLIQIEALIFGVAGFLNEPFTDDYCKYLQKEYRFLKKKYHLAEVKRSEWKFLRLMPANFPTLRLAQFASLIHQSNNLFSKVIDENDLHKLTAFLQTEPSNYWKTHYVLDEASPAKIKKLGASAIQNLIINTIVPFKFAYGKYTDNELMLQNAFDLLEKSRAENNSIIKQWETFNIFSKNSLQTQALLQLKNEYCNKKMCLNCSIGYNLLKHEKA